MIRGSSMERAYHRLPVPLQHAACTAAGAKLRARRYNGDFSRILAAVEERGDWPRERLLEFRDERLRQQMRHAMTTVPWFREQARSLSIDPNCLPKSPAGVLRELPVVDKATVRESPSAFVSDAVPRRGCLVEHTSGTTGAGLRFPTTWKAHRELWATWWRYRRSHGVSLTTWRAQFSGHVVVDPDVKRAPFWRYNLAGRQILFSAYHMSDEHLGAYADELCRRRPPWIDGYPSLIAGLAHYILDEEIDLGYRVRLVTTGAENLLATQRSLIQDAFGVEARQHYGMAEAVMNASGCERGGLHVDEDFTFVEEVPDPDSGASRLVGTNLSNRAFPLLRYACGDLGRLDSGCPCGRPGLLIEQIDGRDEDFVLRRDGSLVATANNVFKDLTRAAAAQIHQSRPGQVVIRVVRGVGYDSSDERHLLEQARLRFGSDMEIGIEYRRELPRSASGKLRLVVSGASKG